MKSSPQPSPNTCLPGNGCSSAPPAVPVKNSLRHWTKCRMSKPPTTIAFERDHIPFGPLTRHTLHADIKFLFSHPFNYLRDPRGLTSPPPCYPRYIGEHRPLDRP